MKSLLVKRLAALCIVLAVTGCHGSPNPARLASLEITLGMALENDREAGDRSE